MIDVAGPNGCVAVLCPVTTLAVLVEIVASSLIVAALVVSVCSGVCASVAMLGVGFTLVVCDLFVLGACSSALHSSRPLERLSLIWARSVLSMFWVRVIEVASMETRCCFERAT